MVQLAHDVQIDEQEIIASSRRSNVSHYTDATDTPLYLSATEDSYAYTHPVTAHATGVVQLAHDKQIDEPEIIPIGDHGQKMDLPLNHVLPQVRETQEVFAFNPPPKSTGLPTPSTVLHSFT